MVLQKKLFVGKIKKVDIIIWFKSHTEINDFHWLLNIIENY